MKFLWIVSVACHDQNVHMKTDSPGSQLHIHSVFLSESYSPELETPAESFLEISAH